MRSRLRILCVGFVIFVGALLLIMVVFNKFFFPSTDKPWVTLAKGQAASTVPKAIEDLEHSNPDARRFAAAFLAAVEPKAESAIPALITALDDEEPRVRSVAAFALGSIGPNAEAAVPKLVAMLSDSDLDVRVSSAGALAGIGPGAQDARPTLTQALMDPEEEMRNAASKAVDVLSGYDFVLDDEAKHQLKSQIPALIEELQSNHSMARYRSATILGQMGADARAAVPKLLPLLTDERRFVRKAAADALAKLDPK